MLRELFTTFKYPDGNFVEQFQTRGFDARTFEIFLFALFREAEFTINRSHKRPDFILEKDGHVVCVEAVTANPPSSSVITPYRHVRAEHTEEETTAYFRDEVPIRFGSPLFSKLGMKYWDLPHVAGRPLVLAIQSFHGDGSLTISSTPLAQYLYGLTHHWYHDASGKLIVSTEPIDEHKAGAKRIPSGFFAQPNAENISAVLFSNTGTVAKFNRMGHEGDIEATMSEC